jgi:hypothetical protein
MKGSCDGRFNVVPYDFPPRNEEKNERHDKPSPRQDFNTELNRTRDRSVNQYIKSVLDAVLLVIRTDDKAVNE